MNVLSEVRMSWQRIFSIFSIMVLLSACAHRPPAPSSESKKRETVMGFPGSYNSDEELPSSESLAVQLDVHKKILRNGLTVLIAENHHLPIFSLHMFYKVGSRYEDKGMTGSSHFLEHLMFKGAKKYGPGEFDSIIEKGGGSSNAYTSMDLTVYHENLPVATLERILDMEADRMQNLLLEKVAFEKERQVILEERKLRYENSPGGQLYQLMFRNLFTRTPYGVPTIGEVADIESVTRDQIQEYFKKFYAPNNAILVLAGDVKEKQAMELIEKYFGEIPRSLEVQDIRDEKDKAQLYQWHAQWGGEQKQKGMSVNPLFILAYAGEPLGTHRAFVMDLLSSILGDGASSYLVEHFVNGKRPLATNISAANYNLRHMGTFFISGELITGVSLNNFEKELRAKLRASCDEAIDERSVQKTKNQYLVDYFHSLQTNSGVASFIGLREAFFEDYEYYKKELEIYNSISTQEIQKVCRELFDHDQNMFFSVWDRH